MNFPVRVRRGLLGGTAVATAFLGSGLFLATNHRSEPQEIQAVESIDSDRRVSAKETPIAPEARRRVSDSGMRVPDIYALLSSNWPDRWLVAWRAGLGRMDAETLWSTLNNPAIASQLEAKEARLQMVLGCNVALGKAELEGFTRNDLVLDWCSAFKSLGGFEYLNTVAGELTDDEALQSAPFRALGPRKLDGDPAERAAELSLLETTFRNAPDPWSIDRTVRSLWAYKSPLVSDDWPDIENLSNFQQSRLRHAAATWVACREIDDCDAASMWTVQFCSSTPGMACPDGAGIDQVLMRNLSPNEFTLLQKIVAHIEIARKP